MIQTNTKLRIFAHNVGTLTVEREKIIRREWERSKPDVVALCDHQRRDLKLGGYETLSTYNELWRWASVGIGLTPSFGQFKTRSFRAACGRSVGVLLQLNKRDTLALVMHYTWPGGDVTVMESHLQQLRRFLDDTRPTFICIMGDFNAHLEYPREAKADVLRQLMADYDLKDIGREKMEPTHVSGTRIDYILTSRNLSVRPLSVGQDRMGSDHHPLTTEITIPCTVGRPSGPLTTEIDEGNEELYHRELANRLARVRSGEQDIPSVMTEVAMLNTVRDSATQQLDRIKRQQMRKERHRELSALIRSRSRLCRAWQAMHERKLDKTAYQRRLPKHIWHRIRGGEREGVPLPATKDNQGWRAWSKSVAAKQRELDIRIQAIYREEDQVAMEHEYAHLQASFDEHHFIRRHEMDRVLRPEKSRRVRIAVAAVNGVVHVDPDDVRRLVCEHTDAHGRPVTSNPPDTGPPWRDPIDVKEDDMTLLLAEMEQVVKRLPSRKSPGSDGLRASHYKRLPADARQLLLKHLNDCLRDPDRFLPPMPTLVVPIKKGDDVQDLSNFRPIALTPMWRRILSRLVASRLGEPLRRILSPLQQAFLPRSSIFEHTIHLTNLLEHAHSSDQAIYIAKLDLKKAYDSVEWWALEEALRRIHMPEAWIKYIMTSMKAELRVETAYGLTDPVYPGRGLLQGDPLSPLLFTVVLDPLLRALEASGVGFRWDHTNTPALAFADDILLIASTAADLQRSLHLTTSTLKRIGIEVNPRKCKGFFRDPRAIPDASPKLDLTLHGPTLEFAEPHEPLKYLGVLFDLDRKPVESRSQLKAIRRTLAFIGQLAAENQHRLPADHLMYIANAAWTAILRYQMHTVVSAPDLVAEIEQHLTAIMKRALNLPVYLCTEAVTLPKELAGAGLLSISAQWSSLMIQQLKRAVDTDSLAGQSTILLLRETQLRHDWLKQPLNLSADDLKSYRRSALHPEWLVDIVKSLATLNRRLAIPQLDDHPDVTIMQACRLRLSDTDARKVRDSAFFKRMHRSYVRELVDPDNPSQLIEWQRLPGDRDNRGPRASEVRILLEKALLVEGVRDRTIQPDLLAPRQQPGGFKSQLLRADNAIPVDVKIASDLRACHQEALLQARAGHRPTGQALFVRMRPEWTEDHRSSRSNASVHVRSRDETWRRMVLYSHNALPTADQLHLLNRDKDTRCCGCGAAHETQEHVFGRFGCRKYALIRASLARDVAVIHPDLEESIWSDVEGSSMPSWFAPAQPQLQDYQRKQLQQCISQYVNEVWKWRNDFCVV